MVALSGLPTGVGVRDIRVRKALVVREGRVDSMPALPRAELDRVLLDAVRESGGVGLIVPRQAANPRFVFIRYHDMEVAVWVYLATITHGGGSARPDEEYRIQITGLSSPLPENRLGPTLLMGYDPNLRVFAAWEFRRHQIFRGRSPSVQVRRQTLVEAVDHGMAVQRKENGEIAVALRPDAFLAYCLSANDIHEAGSDERAVAILERVTCMEEIEPARVEELPPPRRRVIYNITRYTRATVFRDQVLRAYDRRCAVTRWQMNLVEAAHILPVAVGETSIDHVRNGLALSPTYHLAFDQGLIYLTTDYIMRLNRDLVQHLERYNLTAGLQEFAVPLGNRIHLPPHRAQWPDPEFIQMANRYRNIT